MAMSPPSVAWVVASPSPRPTSTSLRARPASSSSLTPKRTSDWKFAVTCAGDSWNCAVTSSTFRYMKTCSQAVFGSPEETAKSLVFLASAAAPYPTGTELGRTEAAAGSTALEGDCGLDKARSPSAESPHSFRPFLRTHGCCEENRCGSALSS